LLVPSWLEPVPLAVPLANKLTVSTVSRDHSLQFKPVAILSQLTSVTSIPTMLMVVIGAPRVMLLTPRPDSSHARLRLPFQPAKSLISLTEPQHVVVALKDSQAQTTPLVLLSREEEVQRRTVSGVLRTSLETRPASSARQAS
jgi:hypothetical protein